MHALTERLLTFFSAGETTYNLRDAQMIRMKVMKLYENIDQLRFVPVIFYIVYKDKELWLVKFV